MEYFDYNNQNLNSARLLKIEKLVLTPFVDVFGGTPFLCSVFREITFAFPTTTCNEKLHLQNDELVSYTNIYSKLMLFPGLWLAWNQN